MQPGRRAYRQARGDLRAAGAGGPDLPVRPGDLVRRPGGGARRQRHRQVALPAAARPRRHRPGPGERRRSTARALAPVAHGGRGPARRAGAARALLADPRPAGAAGQDAGRDPVAGRRAPHRAARGRRRCRRCPATSWPARATSASARSPAASRPGSWCCCWSCPGRPCCCSTSRPTTSTWPRAEALEEGLNAFDGTVIAVTHDRWFTRSFDRFVLFRGDGEVVETPEPVWDVG